MFRVRSLVLLLPLALAGCIFGGGDGHDARRPAPIAPRPAGPITLNTQSNADTRQCYGELARADVRFTPVPDQDFGSGCMVAGAVQLNDIGVPVSGLRSMRCPLANTFTAWVRHGVVPAAREILGSDVVQVVSYGTYSCRGINGGGEAASRRLSEHAFANAVDIAGFQLADGRRVMVEGGWNSPDPDVRRFFRVIHTSACRRFQTVLGPEYNAAHHNHLHFDMGRGPFCR